MHDHFPIEELQRFHLSAKIEPCCSELRCIISEHIISSNLVDDRVRSSIWSQHSCCQWFL